MSNIYGLDGEGAQATAVRAVRRGLGWAFLPATLDELRCAPRARVAVALRQKDSLLRPVRAPFDDLRKARRVLLSLLDVQLPFPVENCVIAVAELRAEGGETRGWVALARTEEIDRALAAWRETGLDPETLDQEALALWSEACRTLPSVRADAERLHVVAYLGEDRFTFVLGRAGRLVAAHGLGADARDQAVRVLKPYMAGGAAVWIFVGPATATPAGEALRLSVTRAWPGQMLSVAEPATFLARALARRQVNAGAYPCNSRTGAFAHDRERERILRRGWAGLAAVLAAGLLLIGANAAWRMTAARREAEAQAELSRVSRLLAPLGAARGSEVATARRIVEQDAKRLDPVLQAGNPELLTTLRKLLTVASQQGLVFDALRLRRGGELQASGVAVDWRRAEMAEREWAGMGIEARMERRDEWADGHVAFNLSTAGKP